MYGDRWKSAREGAGFTVQQAADALGVHRNTIYKLESGGDVTLKLMRNVAAAYGVTLGHVFRDGEQPERIPAEFRPLLEPLRALDQDQREQIIRNVAASLSFMSTIYGGVSRPTISAPSAFKDSQFVTEENQVYTPAPSEEKLGAALFGEGRIREERDVPVPGDRPVVRSRTGKTR